MIVADNINIIVVIVIFNTYRSRVAVCFGIGVVDYIYVGLCWVESEDELTSVCCYVERRGVCDGEIVG